MKRISALTVVAVTAAGSLLLGAAAASASSGPATEVAKSGQYESVVSCPHWGAGSGSLQPILNLPYAPTKAASSTSTPHKATAQSGVAPFDPLVTCTVTFLKQAPGRPLTVREALVHADPGLTVGPAATAIAKACQRASAMHLAPNSCCATSHSGKGRSRTTMYSCCGSTKAPGGRANYVCCTTPRSGHLHGHALYVCCTGLRAVAAFMPACVVLNTGFGGMAPEVAEHQPSVRQQRAVQHRRLRR
ncbi:MAG: hypothetical protein ABSA93_27005 [Streptosporangiaceae bacterium]|jgi:hypothetical protein